MTRNDSLREYRSKRRFDRTPEPSDKGRSGRGKPRFVVHKHDATSLHYDFRLEAAEVLKSWAAPKGPSTDPRDKRLAMRTEDHPVGYADFEGVIPEGEYGAGTVIVWDAGTYDNLTEDRDGREVSVADAVDGGHLTVRLHGRKLGGVYALTRMRSGERERWLLVKTAGEGADARRNPVRTQPASVRSGRTVDEVAAEESAPRR